MAITLPWWGWTLAAIGVALSWFVFYGCGFANGECLGVDIMKREAIRVGLAKACDFNGGWRWWTREEIATDLRRAASALTDGEE